MLVSSCVSAPSVSPSVVLTKTNGDIVDITIMENGISSDSSEVVVKNFYAGARAEMVYRIHNATSKTILPEIFFNRDADVADYSKADGAVRAPSYVESWIELPALSNILPGGVVDFIVALQMPEDEERPAEKIAFQIGVAGKTEGRLQSAVGLWWLVSMK